MHDCETKAFDRRVELQLVCDDAIIADFNAQLFDQAISNLVENAVKYSPPGGEVLVAGEIPAGQRGAGPSPGEPAMARPADAATGQDGPARPAAAPTRYALVRVIDQGVGIEPGEEERIFNRFHRTDTRLARTTAGVGLGLYITRAIVEAHDGRIWAESAGRGRGSMFTMALPVRPPKRV
jgi:signal transduction histidine kinase